MSELVTKAGCLWMLERILHLPLTVALFTAPNTGMSGLEDEYGSFTEVVGGGYQRGTTEGKTVTITTGYETAGVKSQYVVSPGDIPTVRLSITGLKWTFTDIPEVSTIRGYAILAPALFVSNGVSSWTSQSLPSSSTQLNTPGTILFAEMFDNPFVVENPEDELRIPYMIFQLKDW
jgi:hypothetical protein